MLRKILFGSLLIAGSATANAGVIFEEGFDNVAGLGASGWLTERGGTAGNTGGLWFQGVGSEAGLDGVFDAQSGATNSYVASNFLTADLNGRVDNWLVTPLIYAVSGTVIDFSTRTAGNVPGDNLELLVNNVGTDVQSDFVSLGVLPSAFYPTVFTGFFATYVGESTNIRFAFRYTVADVNVGGDYIGIDSVSVHVPEPGTMMLLGAGLLLVPVAMRRRRREQA